MRIDVSGIILLSKIDNVCFLSRTKKIILPSIYLFVLLNYFISLLFFIIIYFFIIFIYIKNCISCIVGQRHLSA